jgi:hypothetical protein
VTSVDDSCEQPRIRDSKAPKAATVTSCGSEVSYGEEAINLRRLPQFRFTPVALYLTRHLDAARCRLAPQCQLHRSMHSLIIPLFTYISLPTRRQRTTNGTTHGSTSSILCMHQEMSR